MQLRAEFNLFFEEYSRKTLFTNCVFIFYSAVLRIAENRISLIFISHANDEVNIARKIRK